MPRTNDSAVQGIIEVDASIALTPFIEVASELVTELCTGSGYTDTRLELIERWLAAHFYAVRDPRLASESVDILGLKQTYQHKVGLGLDLTPHGQQAKRLDTAGNLAALDERARTGRKNKAAVTWLGDEDEYD